MQVNFSDSQVPSFARTNSYDYENADDNNGELYAELIRISEEIEQCRLRNC